MFEVEYDEAGRPKLRRLLGAYVFLFLDVRDTTRLVDTLNDMLRYTMMIPHPRTIMDLTQYVGLLEHPSLDPRCASLIRKLAQTYNLLPGDS